MRSSIAARMVWRLVWQILLSSVLAVVTCYMSIIILERMTRGNYGQRSFFIQLNRFFGEMPLILFGCFVLFIVYMVLLNWRRFSYYDKLSRSVEHIALKGNFDDTVPVKQNNEVTLLAENMNLLVIELKRSLDEERKAEQTKNELITNVSHDLRTPLTSILGYLGLIEQDRYRDEVELRHYVQIAYAKSERLNVLIQDLFEYTRMRHDVVPLNKQTFNLVEMMNQLIVHHRLSLENAKMKGNLIANVSELPIEGDPDKLVRVFENLLTNAISYGSTGGKVDIYLNRQNNAAIIEVVNYGEEIPAADLPHLFDRFYRVDKSRTEHKGGSGLGLAIAKGIVDKHGGTISATSDGNSTNFRVRLPLSEPSPKSPS
ncbi:sensor histidine kinase [Cohnella terricola]|uniref:histidine kinase n=1 Tax=Cohnella terricola TaxID=1289167 RepID=A0A559JX72_9BACL|nr:HAMP domain-containing sensor histidine kinase [Cohnella terricola]TVY04481.1 HAMP domain-containing histidine kinase [Cohnella terricola]